MSGAASWEDTSHHRAVRLAVTEFVRRFGRKRGLHEAAKAIGIGAGAARNAYDGGHVAADPERARRADDARLALIEQEIRRLHAEAAELKNRSHHVVNDGPRMDARRGVLRASRKGVLPARAG
jgi:hypothetical protein